MFQQAKLLAHDSPANLAQCLPIARLQSGRGCIRRLRLGAFAAPGRQVSSGEVYRAAASGRTSIQNR